MALKHLVFLAILKLVSSAAVAEPDPDVIVQVKQIVNAEGCCPGDCCKDYCMLDSKKYRVGDVFEDACILLQCIEGGDWKALDFVSNECGKCTLYADPKIITYNPHTFVNGSDVPPSDWIPEYGDTIITPGEYFVSQIGLSVPASIGVKSNVDAVCGPLGGETCVQSITYYDPDIEVELTVPKGIFEWQPNGAVGCQTDALFTSCETKINIKRGSPLIFENPVPAGCKYCRNIYVVGLKGFTINLIVEPYVFWPIGRYQVNILAENSLSGNLYGLCDRFIPRAIPQILSPPYIYGYMEQDGTVITDNSTSTRESFIQTWKVNQ